MPDPKRDDETQTEFTMRSLKEQWQDEARAPLIEAGDKVAEVAYHSLICDAINPAPCTCGVDDALAAWRKACGR